MTLFRSGLAASVALLALAAPMAVYAQAATPETLDQRLQAMEKRIAEQQAALDEQRAAFQALKAQAEAALAQRQAQIDELRTLAYGRLDEIRGTGAPADDQVSPVRQVRPPPESGPVGAPPPVQRKVEVVSLPEGTGVLTPKGRFVFEPSVDYTHGSTNRLVFRGVEIVTGVQIGVIEASDADRNATSGALTGRFGLTDRLEVELRVPYLYRGDRITTLVQREETATRTMSLTGSDLGDVELAARYQLNRGRNGWPIFIGALRVKSDTGSSPFDIRRDEFGVSEQLATGSGFWAVEPSVSVLYPTDPAVIFASIGYLASIGRDINKDIGGVHVGEVEPGDSINASAGFGFALNQRFSFSLGYKHSYIFPTKSELGPTIQRSESLQVGGFTFGWSLRLTDRMTVSNTYEIGTTRDAPDMRVSFRLPIRF